MSSRGSFESVYKILCYIYMQYFTHASRSYGSSFGNTRVYKKFGSLHKKRRGRQDTKAEDRQHQKVDINEAKVVGMRILTTWQERKRSQEMLYQGNTVGGCSFRRTRASSFQVKYALLEEVEIVSTVMKIVISI